MTFEKLTQPKPWMRQEERQTLALLLDGYRQKFAERRIFPDPSLAVRLKEFLVLFILCERLDDSLLTGADSITPEAAAHLGRAHDRLRHALKALEDTANKLATPDESAPAAAGKAARRADSVSAPANPPSQPAESGPAAPTRPTEPAPLSAGPAGLSAALGANPLNAAVLPVAPRPESPTAHPASPPKPTVSAPPLRPAPQTVIHVPRPEPFVLQQRRR